MSDIFSNRKDKIFRNWTYSSSTFHVQGCIRGKTIPPQTYIYVNKYQHKRYFNYCSINTVFRSNMCFHNKLTTFRLICTSDLPASWRSIINLALVFITTALQMAYSSLMIAYRSGRYKDAHNFVFFYVFSVCSCHRKSYYTHHMHKGTHHYVFFCLLRLLQSLNALLHAS